MIFFGHIGPSLLAGRLYRGPAEFGLKAAISISLWAVLPDLIDKPLYELGLAPGQTARLWAHTLIASLICVLFCYKYFKSQWPWVLAMPGHLFLDGIWLTPVTFWWPLLGNVFEEGYKNYPPQALAGGLWSLLCWRLENRPLEMGGFLFLEAAGLVMCWWSLGIRLPLTQKRHERPVP